jgi:acyl-CoA synthetase (NDP forming)
LRAIRHALDFRDFLTRTRPQPAPAAAAALPRADRWRRLLRSRGSALTEDEGYALLSDYGIAVPAHVVVNDAAAACVAARSIGYPLVLKTASPGILHKSDVGGVHIGLADEAGLMAAYDAMSRRLGPRALVTAQVHGGIETACGVLRDPDFGPFVMMGSGGIWIEQLRDSALVMAPVEAELAAQCLSRLRLNRLLDGVRGAPACDRHALIHVAVQLGVLALELGDCIAEMDLNPVLVTAGGAVAVDCLVVPSAHAE